MDSFDGWDDVNAEVVEEIHREFFKENNDANTDVPAAEPATDIVATPEVVLQDADLGASKPVPEPKPTLAQVKAWRAANFTVRHSTVNACGHKIDLRIPPSNANCWPCWEAFLSTNPEGVASVHKLLLEGGTQAVAAVHGTKFLKMFGKFLQKKLLQEYRQTEGYASGIEGSIMDVSRIEHCRENG